MKTFGSYNYSAGVWYLRAEPHVLLKLKRVFPKVSKRAHGVIRIHDSIEAARDLQWFLERYPLAPEKEEAAAHLAGQADRHREQTALVDGLLAGLRPARAFDLALPARDYQRVAADMTLATGGLLLADDVGLGKTCVGICVISDPRARPALVVTLTHLPRQWESEFRKFAPGLTVHILKKGTPYDLRTALAGRGRQLVLEGTPLPDVIICNYHKLSGWAETLAPIVKTVIFDEGQELRRSDSDKAAAARHIAAHASFRLALTATPIYNYGGEVFNVIDAVRPGALGSRGEFSEEWCANGGGPDQGKIKDPAAFGTYARAAGLMLRRTRADVGRELPPLTKIPHFVDADPEKLAEVESAATELAQIILTQGATGRGEKFRAAEELSMLVRQATGIAKAPYVAEFVRILVANGEKVVLYGWHRAVYDLWLDRLKDLKPAMFTGSESATQKLESFDRFARGETPVFIMSLRAGAGLDGLQEHASTIVFGELDWSPGVHEQCCGRVARDGQTRPVCAYFLITDSGSDPIIADVLGLKTAQSAGIRDPNAPLVAQLQADPDHIKRLAETYLARTRAPRETEHVHAG